jgi:hypothetical protein
MDSMHFVTLVQLLFRKHRMKSASRALSVLPLLLLGACTPAPEETTEATVATEATAVEQAPTAAPVPAAVPASADLPTVEYLMTETVMPNADHIWRAVSYVANAQGVTETKPETDEDWSKLRESAQALINAGDELLDTSRPVYEEFDASTASFQYNGDEIKQLIADNPEPWQNYIEQMQDRTRMTLQAIELKDLVGLQDFGAQINGACENCHADYWYRQPAGQ